MENLCGTFTNVEIDIIMTAVKNKVRCMVEGVGFVGDDFNYGPAKECISKALNITDDMAFIELVNADNNLKYIAYDNARSIVDSHIRNLSMTDISILSGVLFNKCMMLKYGVAHNEMFINTGILRNIISAALLFNHEEEVSVIYDLFIYCASNARSLDSLINIYKNTAITGINKIFASLDKNKINKIYRGDVLCAMQDVTKYPTLMKCFTVYSALASYRSNPESSIDELYIASTILANTLIVETVDGNMPAIRVLS